MEITPETVLQNQVRLRLPTVFGVEIQCGATQVPGNHAFVLCNQRLHRPVPGTRSTPPGQEIGERLIKGALRLPGPEEP